VLEARSTDLALEDAELMAEGEDLDLEGGIALQANEKEVDQGADEGVEEIQDHGLGIMTRRAQPDLRGADTIAGSTTTQADRSF
jgi:hypothetical protein